MLITPLDQVTGTLANADAIKAWFKCDEAATATTLTDAVSGITVAAAITAASSGQLDMTIASDSVTSGTLPAPGAGADFAFLAVIEKGAGAIGSLYYGDSVGQRIILASSASSVTGAAGNATDASWAFSGTGVRKVLIVADASGNTNMYDAAIGASLTAGAKTPVLYSVHGNLTNMGGKMSLLSSVGGTNMKLHGAMLLSFAGGAMPADIVNLCDWMAEQWYDNNKTFYPPLEFV